MWGNPVSYKEDPERLKEVELELEYVNIQDNVEITKENITLQLRKMTKWKAPGLGGIKGFSLKRFSSQHQRLIGELNENIQTLTIPSWLAKNRIVIIQKDPAKGNNILLPANSMLKSIILNSRQELFLISSISIWKMKTCY